jgi:hypothetical protein
METTNQWYVVVKDGILLGVFGAALLESAKEHSSKIEGKTFLCNVAKRPRVGQFFSFTRNNAFAI